MENMCRDSATVLIAERLIEMRLSCISLVLWIRRVNPAVGTSVQRQRTFQRVEANPGSKDLVGPARNRNGFRSRPRATSIRIHSARHQYSSEDYQWPTTVAVNYG